MKRIKKHSIKREKPESSTSYARPQEDYDLAHYIHDRVELMHQVFSVLKHKDIKAMAPECVRHISIDDLQELCTEELLGISSKRLCAILDGAEPPSDTESSSTSQSPEHLETISLDSISSDEEILSQTSSKKSKKHKHRHSKGKKRNRDRDRHEEKDAEHSRASRAGLTVLELLELQARARAIRAQLQQDQASKMQSESVAESSDQDGDVEIKEEPAEVVEISSDEEKPKLEPGTEINAISKDAEKPNEGQIVTKRINDLIITVPQAKQTRNIKLNRSKATVTVGNTEKDAEANVRTSNKIVTVVKEVTQVASTSKESLIASKSTNATKEDKSKEKQKKKTKRKDKKKNPDKEGSDHDEITLQLSDTEKMDLLEDLDRKNFDKLSSSSSEDSENSSSDSNDVSQEGNTDKNVDKVKSKLSDASETPSAKKVEAKNPSESVINRDKAQSSEISDNEKSMKDATQENDSKNEHEVDTANKVQESTVEDNDVISKNSCIDKNTFQNNGETENTNVRNDIKDSVTANINSEIEPKNVIEVSSVEDIPVMVSEQSDTSNETSSSKKVDENLTTMPGKIIEMDDNIREANTGTASTSPNDEIQRVEVEKEISCKEDEKGLSEGELSDRASSEIEAFELQPEVVCISDEETDKSNHKKKKKKEKKSKKVKKSKKSKSDFREGGDQNFFKEPDKDEEVKIVEVEIEKDPSLILKLDENSVDDNYDDVCEILELSDDSSCYEVEGTVLSKEPTAEEIEALSAKIDQIEREDVVTEGEIREHERKKMEENEENLNDEDLENISWKDRYLDSRKVKKVLTTSNIFNALRKKNRDLKKKLEESKKKEEIKETDKDLTVEDNESNVREGSIEHFNALQGSTKYVDPVVEETTNAGDATTIQKENTATELNEQTQITREMKKDAKQLLKMYKRLLKYNDMTKQKDPNRKKKKKSKKKSKVAGVTSVETNSV